MKFLRPFLLTLSIASIPSLAQGDAATRVKQDYQVLPPLNCPYSLVFTNIDLERCSSHAENRHKQARRTVTFITSSRLT